MSAKADALLRSAVSVATRGAWRVRTIDREPLVLVINIEVPNGQLMLRAEPVKAGHPSYRVLGEAAFSYRSDGPLSPQLRAALDRVLKAIVLLFARVSLSIWDAPPETNEFPTPYHCAHLDEEVLLDAETVRRYRQDGYVVVRNALNASVLRALRPSVVEALAARRPREQPKLSEAESAYARAFVQVTNLGLELARIALLTHARRIGKMAADLMGVRAVRLFCEDWLTKESGADITPWHQDAAVFPFDPEASITAWIPFQVVRRQAGALRYVRGSHGGGVYPVENISDESEALFDAIIAEHGFDTTTLDTLRVGDVSFHNGLLIHGADPNRSTDERIVLALHCFADGARIKIAATPTMAQMAEMFAPGLSPGDAAVSPAWPLIYRDDASSVGCCPPAAKNSPAYHLRGVLLPQGNETRDVWIQDGRIRLHPVEGARAIALPDAFITSGLVDSHSHISWPHDRTTPADTVEFMDGNRSRYARTGTTLLRDMGSASDAVLSLGDRPGLPRVCAAGMLILRHEGFPFTPTPPEHLIEVCLDRLDHGARWIKIFTDWSSDFGGRANTGFTGVDPLTYDEDLLRAACDAVHSAGGRVAAHCFTTEGTAVSVRAGVDSLEHGWGVNEVLIDQMARQGTAWVPLVGIAVHMWQSAMEEGQLDRAAWMEQAIDGVSVMLPYALARRVPILAGTDWFPQVSVADEVTELIHLGLDPGAAVGAGTWTARAYLGEAGIVDGAVADVVVYRRDPRKFPQELASPALIFVGGTLVDPDPDRHRPPRRSWRDRATASTRPDATPEE